MSEFDVYRKLAQRDYTNSTEDLYAQLLGTLHLHLFSNGEIEKFYKLLQKAENQNKRIGLKMEAIDQDEYFYKDLILLEK